MYYKKYADNKFKNMQKTIKLIYLEEVKTFKKIITRAKEFSKNYCRVTADCQLLIQLIDKCIKLYKIKL